ncbi:MAG: hypothetical protein ACK5P1_00550, partial [Sphingobacteriia bacterium]
MKKEEQLLVTGLLLTVIGYVLYKVWNQPESTPAMPLGQPLLFGHTKPEPAELTGDLARKRAAML